MSENNSISPDPELLNLFKQEAKTHTQSLSSALLELEESEPTSIKLEPLMRAAHSLKGASRIVGLKDYSQLAHAIEDCFVAAQKGDLHLQTNHFDFLLEAVDFLSQISELSNQEILSWPGNQQQLYQNIYNKIQSIYSKKTSPQPPQTPQTTPSTPQTSNPIFILFQNEVNPQIATIRKHLENFLKSNRPSQNFSNLIIYAQAIKGVSSVANQPESEKIATLLEDTFSKKQKLSPQDAKTILQSVLQLEAIVQNKPAPTILPPPSEPKTPPQPPKPETKPEEPPQSKVEEKFVRVSATNLNKLMALAAESLVETRRLQPLKQGLLQLKFLYHQLSNLLDFSQISSKKSLNTINLEELNAQITQNIKNYRTTLQNQLEIFENFSKNNSILSSKLYSEVLSSRMRPFGEGTQAFPRLIRNLSHSLGKKISLEISGKDTPVDRDILEKLDAPLNHILRNACDHGIEPPDVRLAANKPEKGTIKIDAHHHAGNLLITVSDDGHGIDLENLKKQILKKNLLSPSLIKTLSEDEILEFLFLPGFSTATVVTDISGRGVGLDVVHNLMQAEGGHVSVKTELAKGTSFILKLPITRSVIRALLVEIDNQPYAFPLSRIDKILKISKNQIHTLESRDYFHLDDSNIAIFSTRQVFGFPSNYTHTTNQIPVIVLKENDNVYSLVVDKLISEAELVIRPIDSRLGKIPCIAAASITNEGIPVLIVDIDDILKYLEKLLTGENEIISFSKLKEEKKHVKKILIVDDSVTVRETERLLLQNSGYNVQIALDGADAWNVLRSDKFDLVVTDIDMPRMNGFELLKKIKSDPNYKSIPVIIVSYKDRPEDKQQGLQLGADFYLTKSSFRDQSFVNTVKDIIGPPIS